FVEPEDVSSSSIDRRNGRILNGGIVQKDMPIKLRLINPSHARAGMLVTAINTRFPQEPGQPNPTARGESDESIEITIPHSFNNDIDEFIKLLQHTTIRQANPESVAMSVLRILQLNPSQEIAEAASYRWRALGTRSLPILRKLYDVPDERPRFAAILAGAKLNDPLAIPHLIEMATSSSPGNRFKAIRLMDTMELNPRIEMALRSLLNDDNPNVRIEAYEAERDTSTSLFDYLSTFAIEHKPSPETIDEWAADTGLDGEVEARHRLPPTEVEVSPPLGMDLAGGDIRTIVWATGYRPDYSWLDVPVLDRKGHVRHDGGVVESPGMYLMGAQFLRRRKSALIDGAGDDARDLSDHLASYLDGQVATTDH
ncbi:MAG: hypothetical protein IH993_03030, partial [Proteobacteria bacterium]|nr:hypothetical protein [Pseudomonadota bacterium]